MATVHMISRNVRTPEQWAELIRSKWQDSVSGIMEVGLYLHNAREELGLPAFWKMVRERLRYADSTVKRLIQIGTDARLMEVADDRSHVNGLPSQWGTLYALSTLTDEQFEKGIESGVIHAGMERKDIAQLKPPKEVKAKPAEPQTCAEWRDALWSGLSRAARALPDVDRAELFAVIRQHIDNLEKKFNRPEAA